MNTVFALLVALSSTVAYAKGFKVKNLSLELSSFYNKNEYFIPEYTLYESGPMDRINAEREVWNYEVQLNMDLQLAETFFGKTYWHNTITGRSTTNQFRYTAWTFEVGQSLTDGMDLFYNHKSEHVLELQRDGYPLHDTFGVRFNFIKD